MLLLSLRLLVQGGRASAARKALSLSLIVTEEITFQYG